MSALVNIDLASGARDFQRVALEPGLPMLDSDSSAGAVLQRWLGDHAAEGFWSDDRAEFFATRDGRRQLDAVAEPVTEKDLKGGLKSQFEELQQRIQAISPQSTSERLIADRLREPTASGVDSLVKYRVAGGAWHLVLLWGYERRDAEPATPQVCRKCKSGPWLYLERKATASQCPGCANPPLVAESGTKSRPLWTLAVVAGVLLVAGLLGLTWRNRAEPDLALVTAAPREESENLSTSVALRIEPQDWTTPVGAAQSFRVMLSSNDGGEPSEVTRLVHVSSSDPRVCQFDPLQTIAEARSTGTATLEFRLGDVSKSVPVRVEPPALPASVRLQPNVESIRRGETRRLRLLGSYEDGREVDLTESASWESSEPTTLFSFNGLLEGISPGPAELIVRYAAEPEGQSVETRQTLDVVDAAYAALKLRFEPGEVPVGAIAKAVVEATTVDEETVLVSESVALAIEAQPASLVERNGNAFRALAAGTVAVSASFGELEAGAELTITPATNDRQPSLPERIEMLVGESLDPTELFDVEPEALQIDQGGVLEVDSRGRLIARKVGTATVSLRLPETAWAKAPVDPDESTPRTHELTVDVIEAEYTRLQIVPAELNVPVHGEASVRVVGITETDRRADLAADLLTWEVLPASDMVEFDIEALTVRGVAVTDVRQPMLCRFRGLDAAGYVQVTPRVFDFVIEPGGEVDLPVGSAISPKAFAVYGTDARVELTEREVAWTVLSESEGLEFNESRILAKAVSEQPLRLRAEPKASVFGAGEGGTSRGVATLTVRAAAASEEAFRLDVGQEVIFPGEAGSFRLNSNSADVGQPSIELATVKSSDPERFSVDDSGRWQAIKPGTVGVTCVHPGLAEPITQTITVSEPSSTGLMFHPDVVAIGVGQAAELGLFVVSNSEPNSQPDVEPVVPLDDVRFAVADDSVTLRPPWVIGESAKTATEITAEYRGMTASLLVEVRDVPEATPIRIVPGAITASVNGSFRPTLEQQLPEPTAAAASSDQSTAAATGPANNDDGTVPADRAGAASWRRVDARKATWTGDDGIAVSTPDARSPPVVTVRPGDSSVRRLTARLNGAVTHATIKVDEPRPAVETSRIVLRRYPDGEQVPVGRSQRYGFEIHDDEGTRTPARVQWQPSFENGQVRFDRGKLTALAAGQTQHLEAIIDGKRFRWRTTTVAEAPEVDRQLAERDEQPVALRVVSNDGNPLRLVVGGTTEAVRVEAEYADGLTRDVTGRAELRVAVEDQSTLQPNRKTLVGVGVGTSNVSARFAGIESSAPLPVEVLPVEQVEGLRVTPDSSTLGIGETITLKAIGLLDGQSVGEISQHPDVVWKSRTPEVLSVSGSRVNGLAPGTGGVTAQLNDRVSNVARVVVGSDDRRGELATASFVPSRLTLRVDERKRLGGDVKLRRGEATLQVTDWKFPGEEIARIEGDMLIGVKPGSVELHATSGGRVYGLPVRVIPARRTGLTAPRDRITRLEPVTRDVPDPASPNSRSSESRSSDSRSGVVDRVGPRADRGQAQPEGDAAGRPDSPRSVYDFSGHPASGSEPRLRISPAGGTLAVGGLEMLRVEQVDASGRRDDRTDETRLESSDRSVLRVSGNRVAGVSAGRATVRATLPDSDLTSAVVFDVSDVAANNIEVVPAQVVLRVGEQEPLTVRAAGVTLADVNRLSFAIAAGDDVATVDGRGVVAGRRPGRATVRVTWDGDKEVSVPVTVLPRDVFAASPEGPRIALGTRPASSEPADRGEGQAAGPEPDRSGLRIEIANVRDEQDYSTAEIHIVVPADWADVEFRVAESDAADQWVAGREVNGERIVVLRTPPLTRRTGKLHRVLLESRQSGSQQVERYALRFQLETRARGQDVDSSTQD